MRNEIKQSRECGGAKLTLSVPTETDAHSLMYLSAELRYLDEQIRRFARDWLVSKIDVDYLTRPQRGRTHHRSPPCR